MKKYKTIFNKIIKFLQDIKFKTDKQLLINNENQKIGKIVNYIICQRNHSSYSLETVKILSVIYPNIDAFIAALLSNTLIKLDAKTTNLRLQRIKKDFGAEIANIVDGVIKLSATNNLYDNITSKQKFFDLFSKQQDIATKILFIKLSYLLHNISIFNLGPSSEKNSIIALEIMEIYIPLIARIGLKELTIELQEICLKILQPDIREYILRHLYLVYGDNEKDLINKITKELRNSMNMVGIKAKIFGRIKSPYSIWLKTLQKNVSIEQLHDILAFRIIVDDIEQCYIVLDAIHNQYRIVEENFQDYIHTPKSNGYKSLHTVVIGPDKKTIEIQIRTQKMDKIANYGTAAHWEYKCQKVRKLIYPTNSISGISPLGKKIY